MPEVNTTVGISDIGMYLPRPAIDLDTLVQRRVRLNPRLDRHFERACRVTGQKAIRFPEIWEDSATLAASAVRVLLQQNPGHGPEKPPPPCGGHRDRRGSFEAGLRVRAGHAPARRHRRCPAPCPASRSSTRAPAARWRCSAWPRCSRPAAAGGFGHRRELRHRPLRDGVHGGDHPGRRRGRAGVQAAPRLLELDLATAGYFSADVDDFFRPLGSITARVNGSYSMRCYWESLEAAFLDYCARSGTPARAGAAGDRLFRPSHAVSQHAADRHGEALREGPRLRCGEDARRPCRRRASPRGSIPWRGSATSTRAR